MGKMIMQIKKTAETASVSLRLRKTFTKPNLVGHTVLTDDVFTYVDFYFKKHKKLLKTKDNKEIDQSYYFYWEQARNFYNASKLLPIESSPLTMYYCMLNAAKAYILYSCTTVDAVINDLISHGLHECKGESIIKPKGLDEIMIAWKEQGVFGRLSKMLDSNFVEKWPYGNTHSVSVKKLLQVLVFIHRAYSSTYQTSRRDERFLPLVPGTSPTFYYCNDNKIHLSFDLHKPYFQSNVTSIPEDVVKRIPERYIVSRDNPFRLISKDWYYKKEVNNHYEELRKDFAVITSNERLWYLTKTDDNSFCGINELSATMAVMHRFSEIVRYKPEQMVVLLNGKENWLIHEFLSLALDQFIDKLACEITKEEIMSTRHHSK